ncbi:MAG TPA: hypothetical protein PKL13_02405 [bacterium]|nr:hypothetical protein [bacterium]
MKKLEIKTKDYRKLAEQIDREFNIIMSELYILEQKKNKILKQLETIITEKKVQHLRKKFLNK